MILKVKIIKISGLFIADSEGWKSKDVMACLVMAINVREFAKQIEMEIKTVLFTGWCGKWGISWKWPHFKLSLLSLI